MKIHIEPTMMCADALKGFMCHGWVCYELNEGVIVSAERNILNEDTNVAILKAYNNAVAHYSQTKYNVAETFEEFLKAAHAVAETRLFFKTAEERTAAMIKLCLTKYTPKD